MLVSYVSGIRRWQWRHQMKYYCVFILFFNCCTLLIWDMISLYYYEFLTYLCNYFIHAVWINFLIKNKKLRPGERDHNKIDNWPGLTAIQYGQNVPVHPFKWIFKSQSTKGKIWVPTCRSQYVGKQLFLVSIRQYSIMILGWFVPP